MKKVLPLPAPLTVLACTIGAFAATAAVAQPGIRLNHIGTYESGIFAEGGAEIVAHDPKTQRLFVVNAQDASIDVLSIRNPSNPTRLFSINLGPYGAGVNSVDVYDGIVAAAVEDSNKQAPGRVVFFTTNGQYVNQVTVGSLPDMITFSPNGRWVLTANEGEPNSSYTVDPEGTVSIIDMSKGARRLNQSDVTTVNFRRYNGARLDPSIRIFGPNATVAQDLEPEYIAISRDSKTAYVSLQENNAIAEIDIKKGRVENLRGLGFKNHSRHGNGMDASDRDNRINIAPWPVWGMYLPDAISTYEFLGSSYIVSANEGDAREYDGLNEQTRVGSVRLDSAAFPNAATLRDNTNLGRLRITNTMGDTDRDGDYDKLFSFGARSFSIWNDCGEQVFDSNDDFERVIAAAFPEDFNSDNEENDSFDSRSDDKGPEPEGLTIGKIHGRTYAFIGLERMGGIMVYDISIPHFSRFVQYINTRDFSGDAEEGTAGDLGPEGLIFISAEDSPNRRPLLVVGNEISGTTSVYEIDYSFWWKENMENAPATAGEASGALSQNFPNPFSGSTTIPFTLGGDARVRIDVLSLNGTTVATLADDQFVAGEHTVQFQGNNLAAGNYLYRLTVNGTVREMMQLTLVR